MPIVRCVPLLLCLLFAAPVFAQDVVERAMTPAEFKAAGLDKLSPQELANLNAWLGRKQVEQQAQAAEAVAQARDEGRKAVVTENRGFWDFGSQEPIVARIPGEFRGFGSGKRYTLDNGQVWEQVDAATIAGARRTDAEVSIAPGAFGAWWMKIEGYNTRAKVKRIK